MKSRKRAPTPEWEWQVDTSVKTEGFGEIQEESTYARAWSTQLCKESRNKWMDIIEQKGSVQKVGGRCNLIRGYSTWKPRRNIKWIILYEVNPRAKCSSQSVKRVNRETLVVSTCTFPLWRRCFLSGFHRSPLLLPFLLSGLGLRMLRMVLFELCGLFACFR